MKKVKILLFSLFVSGIILYNFTLLSNNSNVLNKITLSSLLQASAGDIEEVEIICSSGSYGTCFKAIPTGDPLVPWYCEFSGKQDDYCEPD